MWTTILNFIAALPKLITLIKDGIVALAVWIYSWKRRSKRKRMREAIEELEGINKIEDDEERKKRKAEIAKKVSDLFN